MKYDFYLQGSYQNDTNIRRDSDVDVVVQLTSTVRVGSGERRSKQAESPASNQDPDFLAWNSFRRHVFMALKQRFGESSVVQRNKAIKVMAGPPRLAADVVVCIGYRHNSSRPKSVEGMTFCAFPDRRWVVNYPKRHSENGAAKDKKTKGVYKRTVRMFKGARNHLEQANEIGDDVAPSYFLECLVYNAPDTAFQASYQETYRSVVNWMAASDLSDLVCQNQQLPLFGQLPGQWSLAEVKTLTDALVSLLGDWN